jgi:hypothetical protein
MSPEGPWPSRSRRIASGGRAAVCAAWLCQALLFVEDHAQVRCERIASLVGSRHSNPEIAAILYISVLGGEVRRISARSAARAWRLREAGEEVIITGRSQIRKPGRGIQRARTARRP